MSRVISPPSRPIFLDNIDWRTYSLFSRAFNERPGVRLTYDRGRLEIMAALTLEHEDDTGFLRRLVEVLTEELNLPIKGGKSTTLRRQLLKRGLEPDECFWIANAAKMQGRRRLDLRRDPPPDLAIEVVVTHWTIDRMAIYAAFRVPEVWRLKRNVLRFFVLDEDGSYTQAEHSRSFPLVTPDDLMVFVQKAREAANQNVVVGEFREWLKKRRTRG
jgi:Uma2 family endonuclease